MSSNRVALSPLRVLASFAAASLLVLGLTATASYAQTASLAVPRIQSPVSASRMVTLKGNTHPLAQPRFDHGLLPDATPTGHMMLTLKRSDVQQKALDQLVAAQQDPKSASYHKWLTPESFGAQFGVADADLQSVTSYLSSQGFAVGRIFKNKMAVEFSGTTGQMRSAFRTEIHSYAVGGQTFHANASDPQIPAALAPVVDGFGSLNNYKTPHAAAQTMQLNRKTGLAHPLYADDPNQVESVSPGDLAVIYDIPATYTGAGVTIGLVGDSNINLSIPANYRTLFGLPANPPTVIVDGNDPGITADADLAYEQIELLSATAPAANVNFYTSATTDLDTGVDFASLRAVDDNAVQVLVFGFESCEKTLGGYGIVYGTIWEQAAAQGISVISAAGDGGATECDASVNPVTQASQGLAVNAYASTPYDTAVGASDFYFGPTGSVDRNNPNDPFFTYWSMDNSGAAGFTSALRYIPEQPWNQSYQANNQEVFTPAYVLATGGGVSTLGQVTDNGDGTYGFSPYAKPSYQSGFGNSISTTARIVPDVSMFASNQSNGSTYILCLGASDCTTGTPQDNTVVYSAGSGTAEAAASFGGIAALVVQAKGVQGNLNPALYATYSAAPTAFHDITAGANAVGCVTGSPNCGTNGYTTSTGSDLGYSAAAGYDAASGLGSVDVANLISNWKTPTGAATVTLSLTQPGTTTPIYGGFHHGDPVQLNVSVAGGSGVPTGDVSITTQVPQASSKGVEVLTLDASGNAVDNSIGTVLAGGNYQLTARYAGNANYAPAVASIPVSVFQINSVMQIIGMNFTNGATLPVGSPVEIDYQIGSATDKNDAGTATGSINIVDNGKLISVVPLNSQGYASFTSTTLAPGAHAIQANYSGDATYGTAQPTTTPSVTIAGAGTTTTLTGTANSLASRNGTLLLVATVTSTSGTNGPPPGGTIQFKTTGGSLLGSASLDAGNNFGTPRSSSSAFTVQRLVLPVGATSVIATYLPDSTGNYTGSTSAPFVIAVGPGHGLVNTNVALATVPKNAVNFLATGTLSFTATVTQPGGYPQATGNVTFYSNGTALGTATLSGGVATFSIPDDPTSGNLALPIGQSRILAQYGGDSSHASSSTAYTVNVYDEGSTPDFTMQSDQTYQTISSATTTANYRLQFNSLNGFSALGDTITLTSTTPTGITCSAAPIAPSFAGATSTTVTFTCGPSAGVGVGQLTPPNPGMLWTATGGAALACIFLFGMPARRRSWQALVGALAVVAVAFGVTGCGANLSANQPGTSSTALSGGSLTPNATGVLPPGTYTIIVTGTSRVFTKAQPDTTVTVVHNLPLTLVVQ